MPKIIEVIVHTTGQTTVQTKGFVGAACQDASRFMEQALGLTTSELKTPEFHLELNVEQKLPQRL